MPKLLPKTINNPQGFTLIELLVTIAIIAVLSAVGMMVFGGAQKSGRMSKRIQDLKAIALALESYKSNNNSYPTTNGSYRSQCAAWGGLNNNDVVPVATNFIPEYMNSFPTDPQMSTTANTNCYLYDSNGTDYKVLIFNVTEIGLVELQGNENYWDPTHPSHPNKANCPNDGGRRFAIWSSTNSRCW